jgi:hypothetical protein
MTEYKITELAYADAKPMAEIVKEVLGSKRVHFFGMDWGGRRDLDTFVDVLYSVGFENFTRSDVSVSSKLVNNEYRFIKTIRSEKIPEDVEVYVAFEDQVGRTGRSAASGPVRILCGMNKKEIPGLEREAKVYLAALSDSWGIAHFTANPLYKLVDRKELFERLGIAEYNQKHMGLARYIDIFMPNAYLDFKRKGLIRLITDTPQATLDMHPVTSMIIPKERWYKRPTTKVAVGAFTLPVAKVLISTFGGWPQPTPDSLLLNAIAGGATVGVAERLADRSEAIIEYAREISHHIHSSIKNIHPEIKDLMQLEEQLKKSTPLPLEDSDSLPLELEYGAENHET